ncbi:DsbC family protein [Azohydromonas caseinilytica]|uniref:Thiol:disulfide interchange protein n=1 Tax=Azohydromonas caseinilytica TaxID=2728836 RepID=A0A848F9G9_9BURK|nr:DsbC family protein [Azohydromonas caseinilytica]NML15109.1 DsbC family protein [Azohydromonas caseinilytica]
MNRPIQAIRHLQTLGLAALLATAALGASAQEAQIRKNLADRLPNLPKIDEVSRTSVPGLWEVRIGNDVMYTDEKGDHLIQGHIVDTRTRTDLTEQRLNKLSAIDFASLPLKDAVVIKQGSGARKLAVFVDPNCGYCKRFEKDLASVKDVTVYTFLYPILGPDSDAKSKAIWCAKDPAKTWRDWMLNGVTPPRAMGECDSNALQRNVAFGKKHRVQGTPALVFEDGTRVPGAVSAAEVEKQLAESARKS